MREIFVSYWGSVSQWPKWLRRQYGKLEICGSCPGYDTDFSLKNYHFYGVEHTVENHKIVTIDMEISKFSKTQS